MERVDEDVLLAIARDEAAGNDMINAVCMYVCMYASNRCKVSSKRSYGN